MTYPDEANRPNAEIEGSIAVGLPRRRKLNSAMPADRSMPTRASLLERLKDLSDNASWTEFYNTYRALIYGVARKAGLGEIESEEVVQETLITVARKMPEFTYDPAKDSFKGWLLTVTRWRILDQFQKRKLLDSKKRLVVHGPAEADSRTRTVDRIPDPGEFDLTAIWNEEWSSNRLHAALARIKRQVRPQQYEIYHLHVILEKPVREVSQALGVSAGQVYLAKHRVGSLLKKEIKRLEKLP